jgi:hypothetical protein
LRQQLLLQSFKATFFERSPPPFLLMSYRSVFIDVFLVAYETKFLWTTAAAPELLAGKRQLVEGLQ